MTKARYLFPSLILLAVLLSGCNTSSQLQSQVNTQQEKKAKPDWQNQGNLYSTIVNYSSPGGDEGNEFKLTVENGIVTKVEVVISTQIDASIVYQKDFSAQLPPLIEGKPLSSFQNLDTVAGASLTTAAFNQAVNKLKVQLGV